MKILYIYFINNTTIYARICMKVCRTSHIVLHFSPVKWYGAKLTIDPTVRPPPPLSLSLSVLLSRSSSLMSGFVSWGVVFRSLIPYTCLM